MESTKEAEEKANSTIPAINETTHAPGRVLMNEEVYATWVATGLILAVMGSQFTSRPTIKADIRITLDILTMLLSLFVLAWATFSHFNVLPHRYRPVILVLLITLIMSLIIGVIVCVSVKKV
jgi:hypothetical protein